MATLSDSATFPGGTLMRHLPFKVWWSLQLPSPTELVGITAYKDSWEPRELAGGRDKPRTRFQMAGCPPTQLSLSSSTLPHFLVWKPALEFRPDRLSFHCLIDPEPQAPPLLQASSLTLAPKCLVKLLSWKMELPITFLNVYSCPRSHTGRVGGG